MKIEEANNLKDKMDSLSLNSCKTNQVECTMPTSRDISKVKGKKNQKLDYPKQQNKFGNKI